MMVMALMVRGFNVGFVIVLCAAFAHSQAASDPATVTFSLDFPGSLPSHYSIRVDRNGASHYASSGKSSAESELEDDFTYDFTVSEASRQKIFELAGKAEYFQRD